MINPTEEQKLAIEKAGMNIIVSAGAGSGKTPIPEAVQLTVSCTDTQRRGERDWLLPLIFLV